MATKTAGADPARPRFHFIGGKGGTGKTTCAAALAVASAARGERVLVASTDPAPSLGDALAVRLSSTPTRVPLPKCDLWAVEIDAPFSLRRWLDERRPVLEEIAVEGTWLERGEVAKLLRLSLPGIDEVAALLEIARLAGTQDFDLIVVDTAPTGHTLRMLAMPETLAGIAGVFDEMREKGRVMELALRGATRVNAGDALIREIDDLARDLAAALRDQSRTCISWVTLPEPMAVAETRDAVTSLQATGIGVNTLIVNRLTRPSQARCGHCEARRAFERRSIRRLPAVSHVRAVSLQDVEPRGAKLAELAEGSASSAFSAPSASSAPPNRRWKAELPGIPVGAEQIVAPSTRLVMFGGKGGVGKTTCAAAVALTAAQRSPSTRVLLVSTDPAHSLADVFATAVSDEASVLPAGPPNLRVRELDPSAVLAALRERYLAAVDEMFDRMRGRSFDVTHDRGVMRSLIELAPPGLDELAAILEITDAIAASPPAWDLVVIDTAPTGHALRLLEMPALIHDWTRGLMSILLEYQGVTRLGGLGEALLRLSQGVRRLRALLTDADQSSFVVVTRAAALPRLESARLCARLAELQVHVPAVVVNAVGHGTCARCRRMGTAERRELLAIRKAFSPPVIVTGAEVPPPIGATALRRWARTAWRGLPGYYRTQ